MPKNGYFFESAVYQYNVLGHLSHLKSRLKNKTLISELIGGGGGVGVVESIPFPLLNVQRQSTKPIDLAMPVHSFFSFKSCARFHNKTKNFENPSISLILNIS